MTKALDEFIAKVGREEYEAQLSRIAKRVREILPGVTDEDIREIMEEKIKRGTVVNSRGMR